MKRRSLHLLLMLGIACGSVMQAHADAIDFGIWYEFSFTRTDVLARGCFPADPMGLSCIPSVDGNTIFADAPAWTFMAPAEGVALTVTDAFLRGDSFRIFDFGVLIGETPFVPVLGDCGSNPDICLQDPLVSHEIFFLSAGAHSITIIPSASPYSDGAAYFRMDAVPEPSTIGTLMIGILSIALYRRSRRQKLAYH